MSSVTPLRVFGPDGVGVAVAPARVNTVALCADGIADNSFCLPEQAVTSHSAANIAVSDQPAALTRPAVEHATARDHSVIQRLLTSVLHAPSQAEFQAELDQPLYDPSDRLVVKEGSRIVSHVFASSRMMDFDSLRIPVGVVDQLVTLPEHRGQGNGSALLEAAEEQLAEDGAVLAVTWTDRIDFFRSRGWTLCGRHCYSEVSPRDLLAELEIRKEQVPKRFGHKPPETNVRLWWHYERPALLRLHKERFAPRVGAFHRNDERWQWLISRRAFDRIFVAIDGPLGEVTDDASDRIVGYAIVNGDRVVELVTAPDHPEALPHLLRRICGDAIERDDYELRFDAPSDDPVHEVIKAAGGRFTCCQAERGVAPIVKLLDPQRFVTQLCPALHERAKAADLPRPFEVGLQLGAEPYRLTFSRRSVKLVPGTPGPDRLDLQLGAAAQMLLGHASATDLATAGRIGVTSLKALELARTLVPRRPLWLPPWDDLPAP
jgi:GNAT superfamily N-acetyltransferase